MAFLLGLAGGAAVVGLLMAGGFVGWQLARRQARPTAEALSEREDRRLREEGLQARIILQVHDELIVECPEVEAEQAARILTEEMEQVAELSVPLTVDAHWGRNWMEAKG